MGLGNVAKASKVVLGMDIAAEDTSPIDGVHCVPCVKARMERQPFQGETSSTSKLELLHVDLVGPLDPSRGGCVHFLGLHDDKTEFAAATPLRTKAEGGKALRNWIVNWENQSGLKVKRLRADGAGELIGSADMQEFFQEKGISVEPTAPYSPQSNGAAERLNRTLMERVRAMLVASAMSKEFWSEALMTVVFTHNRAPTKDGKSTPFERFYGKKPDVGGLRVWGSTAYALQPPGSQRKLGPKVIVGRMVGYGGNPHSYRILVPNSNTVLTRRDVVVEEDAPEDAHATGASGSTRGNENDTLSTSTDAPPPSPPDAPPSTPQTSPLPATPSTWEAGIAGGAGPSSGQTRSPYLLRRGPGAGLAEALQDIDHWRAHAYSANQQTPTDPYGKLTVHEATKAPWWNNVPPTTYAEAMSRPDADLWRGAMDDEVSSLDAKRALRWMQGTPTKMHITGSKWVYDYKTDADGNVNRYKARFVAKGYTQLKGVDYEETWAPCPGRATVRAVLAMAADRDWEMHSVDVKTAYLNATMDKEMYIHPPKGYERGEGMVCEVLKAIYGAKQAGNLWAEHLHVTLTSVGARRSEADHCLYILADPGLGTIFILVHVDDVAFVARTLEAVLFGKRIITDTYEARDSGELRCFLGMRVERNRARRTLTLSCPGHIHDLIKEHGLVKANPAKLPMTPGLVLAKTGNNILPDATIYQALVGSLNYLATTTRPDIAWAVGRLSLYLQEPEDLHWRAAKSLLRYLCGTAEMGLVYNGRDPVTGAVDTHYPGGSAPDGAILSVDADYAGCSETRRSTTGWVFTLNGAAIHWASKRQPTVSTSTAEAEYVGLAEATRETMWLRKLQNDLGYETDGPLIVGEDNQACLAIANNTGAGGRVKHIDTKHHMVRERVASGELKLVYVPTDEMVADGLTKALPEPAFSTFRDKIGVGEATTTNHTAGEGRTDE